MIKDIANQSSNMKMLVIIKSVYVRGSSPGSSGTAIAIMEIISHVADG